MFLVELVTFRFFVVQRGQRGRVVVQRVSRLGLFDPVNRSGFSHRLLRDARCRKLAGGWPRIRQLVPMSQVGLHCSVRSFPRDGSDLPQFRLECLTIDSQLGNEVGHLFHLLLEVGLLLLLGL